MIRVAIVDDEPLVRAGLKVLLEAEDDIEVVGEAADGSEVVRLVREQRPDVVLMDVRMPRVDGIQATQALLRRSAAPPKVVVLTTFEHDDHVYGALRVGAAGFLLKRTPPEEIVAAIRLVHGGDSLLFPAAIRALADRNATVDVEAAQRIARLTDREAVVLRAIARGASNAEIARDLHLGVETVKTHVSNVLTKLGSRDRTQAVIVAYEGGLLQVGGR